MDVITSDLNTPHPYTLLYADDVVITTTKRDELEEVVCKWKDRLAEFGMRLNVAKTEYLEFGVETPGTVKIDNRDLNKVSNFKYLGSMISANNDAKGAATSRIAAAWMKWRDTTGVLCDKRMPDRLKSKIYRTVVRPVILYGAETLPCTQNVENTFHTNEMKMLRWSVGLTRLDRVPNADIRKRLGIAPITSKLRESRMRWYGHVLRRERDEVARNAWEMDVKGKRPRGRPKTRWKDVVAKDLVALSLHPSDAQNRALWSRKTRQADPAVLRD